MQREVNAIIAETLECYGSGAIEEEELVAFGLTLRSARRRAAGLAVAAARYLNF